MKALLLLPFGIAAIFTSMVVSTLTPPTGFSVFHHMPTFVVMVAIYLIARAIDTGRLLGARTRPHEPGDPLKGVRRWDTAAAAKTVYLTGAAVVGLAMGVLALKLPVVIADDYKAGVFILGTGIQALLVIMVVMIIMAFRKPGILTLDATTLTFGGGEAARVIPLSNIEEVVLRPRTDPLVVILRLIEPPKDIALELGRLSLDPLSFAHELIVRRPSITLSTSTPGAFASGGAMAKLSDGGPGDFR